MSAPARYAAALDFLHGRIDYERAALMPYRKGEFRLDRMRELLRLLGNPQDAYPIVHVAGTKGKGSTAAMIGAILGAAGISVGLFTSPHLERIEERIRWNGEPVTPDEFATAVDALKPAIEELDRAGDRFGDGGPTFFEITTAMALWHFALRGGAVVLEVGLGGRLDSTNVVTPAVCVITSISFDHTKQLGRTLAEIAGEKAGIVKSGIPLICGVTQAEPRTAIARIAAERAAPLVQLGRDFDVSYRTRIVCDAIRHEVDFLAATAFGESPAQLDALALGLVGRHQAENAALAIAAVDALQPKLPVTVSPEDIRTGLAELRWPARIETLRTAPRVVLDAAHNTASIAALLETLSEERPTGRRILIFAASRDKDVPAMLRQLYPFFDEIVLTQYEHNPRYVPLETLRTMLADTARTATGGVSSWHRPWLAEASRPGGATRTPRKTPRITETPLPRDAWLYVQRIAQPDDLITATGSFFLAAELRPLILGES